MHLCVRRSGVLGVEMKTLPVKVAASRVESSDAQLLPRALSLTHRCQIRTSGSLIYIHKSSVFTRPGTAADATRPRPQLPAAPSPARVSQIPLSSLAARRGGAPPPPVHRCLIVRLEIPTAPPCTVRLAQSRRYPTMQHNPSPLAPLVRRSPPASQTYERESADPLPLPRLVCVCV